MLHQLNVGESKVGVVFGKVKFIVTSDDGIHRIYDNADTVTMDAGIEWSSPDAGGTRIALFNKEVTMNLDEIKAEAKPIKAQDFMHYWGIEDRVARNYYALLRSAIEIGVDTSHMPKWGEA